MGYGTNNFKGENKENTKQRRKEKIQYYRIELMNILGGVVCCRCDFKDVRALQFDHINNDGFKEKKQSSVVKYKYYVDRPELARETLQVLCANCNQIKEMIRRDGGNC